MSAAQVAVRSLVIDTTPQWELPYLWTAYISRMRSRWMSAEQLYDRGRSHVRQCFRHLWTLALHHGKPYDVLVKIRADLIFVDELSAAPGPQRLPEPVHG